MSEKNNKQHNKKQHIVPKAFFVKSKNPQYTFDEVVEMLIQSALDYIDNNPEILNEIN